MDLCRFVCVHGGVRVQSLTVKATHAHAHSAENNWCDIYPGQLTEEAALHALFVFLKDRKD